MSPKTDSEPSTDQRPQYLAAYGTLRPGCRGQELLGITLKDLGPVHLPGRLWLSPSVEYPGRLVPGFVPEAGFVSYARLLEVPEDLWPRLDAWEGCQNNSPEGQYRRQSLRTLEGPVAEVYILQAAGLNFIRGGDWLRYAHHEKSIPALRPEISWRPAVSAPGN